jgi:DNA-binding MarR family transcriptional regulator
MPAPKGNRNALKHGLYARRIHRDEAARIGSLPVVDIEGEIAYTRAVISRIALILEKNGLSYKSTRQLSGKSLKTLNSLDNALRTLLSYIRLHALLTGNLDEWEQEIDEARRLARLDMKIHEFFTFPGSSETDE